MKMHDPARQPRALVFGEALWDLLPSGEVLGGAPLNFAYRLGSLGVPTWFVSQVGDDDLGRRTLDQMTELGMDTSLVSVSRDLPTATVIVELDDQRQPHYTIVENVAYDAVPWSDELGRAAEEADILCFGTLAQRDPRSRSTLRRIVEAFSGDTVLVDINLRTNCYTEETVRWSLAQGTIAKLNDQELVEIGEMYGAGAGGGHGSGSGREDGTEAELESLIERAIGLRKVIGLATLVVTLGSAGALAVVEGGEPVVVPGFQVTVDDPCGAGDAFAGMFMASVIEGLSLEESLTRANALGAAVATQPGATQIVSQVTLEELIRNGTRVEPSA